MADRNPDGCGGSPAPPVLPCSFSSSVGVLLLRLRAAKLPRREIEPALAFWDSRRPFSAVGQQLQRSARKLTETKRYAGPCRPFGTPVGPSPPSSSNSGVAQES
jgi:hypothetical protein